MSSATLELAGNVLPVVLLAALALAAGVLSGIVGTGSSLILLPVLVAVDGPRVAVPVMALASMFGNIGRIIAWWQHIRWRPVLAYSVAGVPAAVCGANVLLSIPPGMVEVFLAAFFLAMIPGRRLMRRSRIRIRLWQMALAGAVIGFLTGLVLATGPLSVPVFSGYGMTGGAFLGSEAASAVLLYAGKLATFGFAGAVDAGVVARGVSIGVMLLIGSMFAKRIVLKLATRSFEILIDIVLGLGAVGVSLAALSQW